MASLTLDDAAIELVNSLSYDEIPTKLRCAGCNKFAVNAFRLPCCDQSICQTCQQNLHDSCPVCEHSPVTPDSCSINKSERKTGKAFVKTQAKKRENKALKEAAAQAPAAADVTSETPAARPSETPAPIAEVSEQNGDTEVAAPGEDAAVQVLGQAEQASAGSANEVRRSFQLHRAGSLLTSHQPQATNEGDQAMQTEGEVATNIPEGAQDHSDAGSDDTQIKVDMDEEAIQGQNEVETEQQAPEQYEQNQQDESLSNGQQHGGYGYDQNQQAGFGNMGMGGFNMNNFNPMANMQGGMGMPFGGNMMGNNFMNPGMMDPSMMFNNGFGGMNGMNGMNMNMNMMGGGMMGMGGFDNGMSGMGMNGGPGFFPHQGGYNNFGNHMSNQFPHDRGYHHGNRPYGRGGRGRGGYGFNRGGRGGYGQFNQHNQFNQGHYQGPGFVHGQAQQQQSDLRSGVQDNNTPQAEAPEEGRRGSPTYQDYRGPQGENAASRDSRQENKDEQNPPVDPANPHQSEAGDLQERKLPGDEEEKQDAGSTQAQGRLTVENLRRLSRLRGESVTASIEPNPNEPLVKNSAADDELARGMHGTSMTPSQMTQTEGGFRSNNPTAYGGTPFLSGMQAGGARGGYGGFRGRGGYGGMTDAHSMPAPPAGAPTGPKAFREGRPNVGFAPRGGHVPTGPARQVSEAPREPEEDRDRTRDRDEPDQDRDRDHRSPSRSTHRSRRHRHRSTSVDYESEETRARRKDRERERRKRKERDAYLLESESASKKPRSRSSSPADDSSSRRAHRRSSHKDDKHRSSRRDRSRGDKRRRRHRSASPIDPEDEKYATSTSRRDRDRDRDRYYDDDQAESRGSGYRKSTRRDRDDYETSSKDKDKESHRSSRRSRADDPATTTSSSRRSTKPDRDDEVGFKIKGSKSASGATADGDAMPPPSSTVAAGVSGGAAGSGDPYAEERAKRQREREARFAEGAGGGGGGGVKRGREEGGGRDGRESGGRRRRISYRYEDEIGGR
ncbi:hypothetical protein MBLNU230_g4853t1 [Neophaeotheca triangularis]